MTSAVNSFEQELLDLIFLNVNIADIGDETGLQGSSAAGSLYVSLHTADPGEAGTQNLSEADYTGYARVAVARDGTGWSRSGSVISNAAEVAFPTNTGSSQTVTHWGVGKESSGATDLILRAALSSPIEVESEMAPSFLATELTTGVQ